MIGRLEKRRLELIVNVTENEALFSDDRASVRLSHPEGVVIAVERSPSTTAELSLRDYHIMRLLLDAVLDPQRPNYINCRD